MLDDFTRLWSAIRKTGLLNPNPPWAILQLLWCLLRYGVSLYTLVAWNALRNPNILAVIEPGNRLSYLELQTQSEQLAKNLRQLFPDAKSVGILCRNSIAYVEILLACGRLGLEAVLLNTTFSSEQLAALLQKKPLDLIFCDEDFRVRLEEARAKGIIVVEELPELAAERTHTLPPSFFKLAKITVLTSGSTGPAKLVQRKITPGEALGTITGLLNGLKPRTGDSILLTLPLLHGHGLATLALSLAMGSPLYLFSKAKAEDFLECIETNSIKVLVLVPTILYRLVESLGKNTREVSSIRTIVCGSAPLGESLATQTLELFGPVLFNLYGSSEIGIISLATPEDLQQTPNTVGYPLPKANLRVLRTDKSEVKPLETGQVWARGHNTGDMGFLDESGRLFLVGRADDLLICGGENVYPQAIEDQVCSRLESIQECAAIGIPDAEYGQAIHLFVVLRHQIGEGKIKHDLEAMFPRTLRPKKITIVESLPRNLAGKIQRFKLQDAVD